MKDARTLVIIILLSFTGIKCIGQRAVTILRIGDSNTRNYTMGTYFDNLMKDEGILWEALGTQVPWDLNNTVGKNEGYNGVKIEFFTQRQAAFDGVTLNHVPIERMLTDYKPDFIFLMVGTNNIQSGDTFNKDVLEFRYETLLEKIDEMILPNRTQVIVAKILRTSDESRTALNLQFNEEVVGPLVQAKIDEGKQYHLVDASSILNLETDMREDGLHPNTSGNAKVNDMWFSKFKTVYEANKELFSEDPDEPIVLSTQVRNGGFRLYPNPVVDHVLIPRNYGAIDEVHIYDMASKAYNVEIKERVVDLSNLPIGVYAMTLVSGQESITIRLLKE